MLFYLLRCATVAATSGITAVVAIAVAVAVTVTVTVAAV